MLGQLDWDTQKADVWSIVTNSPFTLSYNGWLIGIELKAKAKEVELAGNQVPDHIKLPELQDILLKMRPPPTWNARGEENDHQDKNMTAFTFIMEHLMGAILGKKMWDKYKCGKKVLEKFTPWMKPTCISPWKTRTTCG
jgi:hypothetical protein